MPDIIPFKSVSGQELFLYVWKPEGEIKAKILVLHGMAEHISRYDEMARTLNEKGYAVAGYDHMGHGEKAPIKGYIAREGGWDCLVEDGERARKVLCAELPAGKTILLGHSMGSFLARETLLRYGNRYDLAVLSGTGWHPKALCLAGKAMADAACVFGKEKKPCKAVDSIAFSANNKPFKPARTAFDWLSRDEKKVDEYVSDPLCGFVFTGGGFRDLFGGLLRLSDVKRLENVPKTLPLYLMSGERDPVGGQGKGVREIARQYTDAGLSDVTVKLYPGARHELFNEINRDEVIIDLINWMEARL